MSVDELTEVKVEDLDGKIVPGVRVWNSGAAGERCRTMQTGGAFNCSCPWQWSVNEPACCHIEAAQKILSEER